MSLNREQFLRAVEKGEGLLFSLKKDYPELKLSPVFSRFGPRSGQCDLTTNLRKIVMDFPDILAGEFSHREGTQGSQKENVDAVFAGVIARAPRSQCAGKENFSHEKHQNSSRWNETSGRVQEDGESAESLRVKPSLRAGLEPVTATKWQSFLEPGTIQMIRTLLMAIKGAEKDGENETVSKLWKEANAKEKELLDPELKLYCGDVLIEYRPGNLKYESLRRLQQDSRLPPGLNKVGNIRVIASSLEFLCKEI
jgi:hypothetical protein